MVGTGSLEENAKAFGIPVKNPSLAYLQVKTPHDVSKLTCQQWLEIEKYCKTDVLIATELVHRFDKHMEAIARSCHHKKKGYKYKPWTKSFYARPSLAATAYDIVHRYSRAIEIHPLTSVTVYNIMRASYRGGVTQVLTQDRVFSDQYHTIKYYDINSMYPYIMSHKLIIPRYDERIQFIQGRLDMDRINPSALYAVRSFQLPRFFEYGLFPVTSPSRE